MLTTTFASYILLGVIGLFAVTKIIADKKYAIVTLLLNLVFGGALYIILGFFNVELPFNVISASCITILGAPGVVLLVILKFVFGTI